MTLQEYITYALAKKQIEYHSYDPRAKFQCVDLANDYITKVWGLEAIIGTDAKDFPERLKPGMEYVPNSTDYLPEAGEVAVWNSKVGGGAGHIAVVTKKGLQTVFYSLDQNWSKPLFITQEKHSYSNVRGFIRKKGTMANELETCMADRLKFWQERDVALVKVVELEKQLAQKPKEIIKEVPVTVIKEVVITKEVPVEVTKEVIKTVEVIKEVVVQAPGVELGGLAYITLALKAIVAGKW